MKQAWTSQSVDKRVNEIEGVFAAVTQKYAGKAATVIEEGDRDELTGCLRDIGSIVIHYRDSFSQGSVGEEQVQQLLGAGKLQGEMLQYLCSFSNVNARELLQKAITGFK